MWRVGNVRGGGNQNQITNRNVHHQPSSGKMSHRPKRRGGVAGGVGGVRVCAWGACVGNNRVWGGEPLKKVTTTNVHYVIRIVNQQACVQPRQPLMAQATALRGVEGVWWGWGCACIMGANRVTATRGKPPQPNNKRHCCV